MYKSNHKGNGRHRLSVWNHHPQASDQHVEGWGNSFKLKWFSGTESMLIRLQFAAPRSKTKRSGSRISFPSRHVLFQTAAATGLGSWVRRVRCEIECFEQIVETGYPPTLAALEFDHLILKAGHIMLSHDRFVLFWYILVRSSLMKFLNSLPNPHPRIWTGCQFHVARPADVG